VKKLVMAAALAVVLGAPLSTACANPQKAADPVVVNSDGFLAYHPDLRFRRLALRAFETGEHEEAATYFRRAARFADKPSQGMYAEMLWTGRGLPQDRPLAYAWMDLAAERGYRTMSVQREIYWRQLDEAERERALAEGAALYAEYGDQIAQPRLEAALRRGRKHVTGSRTGAVGSLKIIIATPSGEQVIDGSNFYHPSYWEPQDYWAWQDAGWKDPPRGVVDIGPMQVGADAGGEPGQTRDRR
jgi:uncharacterized protein